MFLVFGAEEKMIEKEIPYSYAFSKPSFRNGEAVFLFNKEYFFYFVNENFFLFSLNLKLLYHNFFDL